MSFLNERFSPLQADLKIHITARHVNLEPVQCLFPGQDRQRLVSEGALAPRGWREQTNRQGRFHDRHFSPTGLRRRAVPGGREPGRTRFFE